MTHPVFGQALTAIAAGVVRKRMMVQMDEQTNMLSYIVVELKKIRRVAEKQVGGDGNGAAADDGRPQLVLTRDLVCVRLDFVVFPLCLVQHPVFLAPESVQGCAADATKASCMRVSFAERFRVRTAPDSSTCRMRWTMLLHLAQHACKPLVHSHH